MGRKGCGADAKKEKFERFLEKRGRWEEKRVFLGNPERDFVEEKLKRGERV